MRRTICLVVVLMCAWVSAFGQNNAPQWKVIKAGHIKSGTNAVGPLTLFTPTKNGVYRVSLYMSVSSNLQQNAGWLIQVAWIDQTGLQGFATLFPTLGGGSIFTEADPYIFSPQIGTPVTLALLPSDPPPQNATYDAAFTIEKLTK